MRPLMVRVVKPEPRPTQARRPADAGVPWNACTEMLRVLRTVSHRPGRQLWHRAVLVSLLEQRLRRAGLQVATGPAALGGGLPPLDLVVEGSIGVYVLRDPRPDAELLQQAMAACTADRLHDATPLARGLTHLVVVTGWRPSQDLPSVVNRRRVAWLTIRDQAVPAHPPADPKRTRRTSED